MRWNGWVQPRSTGEHRFRLANREGVVMVNRETAFDRAGVGTVSLDRARFYAIVIDQPAGQQGQPVLMWELPDGRREVVPQTQLFPPVATVRTPAPSV